MSETFLYKRPVKSDIDLNIWLCFPGVYAFGMSSLGYLSIFKAFDVQKKYFVERIFTDTKITNKQSSEVDLMGISVSFEIDFLQIFKIFDKYKIPYKSADREEGYPLIYGGGPVLTANPEPYAEFFDFIMIGDGEEANLRVAEFIRANKQLSKEELLKKLAELGGIYVPALTEFDFKNNQIRTHGKPFTVHKQTVELTECLATPILTEDSFFPNTHIIELSRGCPMQCKFCMASYLNLPYRYANYEQIIKSIELGLQYTNKIAFLGALVSGHPRFEDICDYVYQKVINGQHIELSVSSLRADRVSEKAVKTLVACGQKHATIAIEAGSERLRKTINKNITEKDIFHFVQKASDNGLKGVKIYAMIGLPTETDKDIKELVDLMLRLKAKYKTFDFTVSFATFVPKAHTPFQFVEREKPKSLEKKYNYVKKHLAKKGIKVRVSSIKWDDVQALFSRGDRRLCDYAIEVYKAGGKLGAFRQVYKSMQKKKLLPDYDEAVYATRDPQKNLAWNFIKISPGIDELIEEFEDLA